jgi:hypothetical protein
MHMQWPSNDGYAVQTAWKNNGDYDEVCRRQGYRFRLIKAIVPDACGPGNALTLSIDMTNDGWAGIMNPRGLEIILRNKSNGALYELSIDGDGKGNRMWLPRSGETRTLSITGGVPADIPEGMYDALLNLPDPYPSIHSRPEYAIRLANTNTWEAATGYNKLNATVTVAAAGGGEPYAGTGWFGSGVTVTPPPDTTHTGSTVSSAGTPYGGTPHAIPGRIEAEMYNTGGEGVAYHDLIAGNELGALRADDVDIEATTDPQGGGYQLGHTGNGEWLCYTVQIANSGTYTIRVRVASGQAMQFHLYCDDIDISSAVDVASTGSWVTWTTKEIPGLPLTSGIHVLKFSFTSSGFCLNWIDFALDQATPNARVCPVPAILPPAHGSEFSLTGAKLRTAGRRGQHAVGGIVIRELWAGNNRACAKILIAR